MKTFVATLLLTALTACGTAPRASTIATQGSSDSKRADKRVSFDTGSFKLYKTPDFVPNPQCDEYIRLDLLNGFTGPLATLEPEVQGSACQTTPPDDHHAYNVSPFYLDACQSKVYVGKRDDGSTIEVVDHRQRNCGDKVVAKIIVTEKTATGFSRTLYIGANEAVQAEHLKGVMVKIATISGESSGYAIQLENGKFVELNLAAFNQEQQFVEGRHVIVRGYYEKAAGAEKVVQRAFIVEHVEDVAIN